MEQMTWREALDDAKSSEDFDAIEQWVQSQIETTQQSIATLFERGQDVDVQAASALVRAWMFLERFEQSVQDRRAAQLSHNTL
jgi:molecular chaperone HscB